MQVIEKDGVVLARHILEEDWNEGLNFFSEDSEYIQLGAWSYDEGKELLAHVHNEVPRQINRTYEVLYIRKGKIRAKIYTLQEEPVCEFDVKEGELLVLLECGHGYTILEDGTKVIEIKNGPYLGADVDRRRI